MGDCEICGHPYYDHIETRCDWIRHGALRMCDCPGYKDKGGLNMGKGSYLGNAVSALPKLEKFQMKGNKLKDLILALSRFPENSKVKVDRKWVQEYNSDQVFTITFNKAQNRTEIEEIY